MGERKISVISCDRCGHEAHDPTPADRTKWGGLRYAGHGSASYGYDKCNAYESEITPMVCPGCLDEVDKWWNAPRNKAAEDTRVPETEAAP